MISRVRSDTRAPRGPGTSFAQARAGKAAAAAKSNVKKKIVFVALFLAPLLAAAAAPSTQGGTPLAPPPDSVPGMPSGPPEPPPEQEAEAPAPVAVAPMPGVVTTPDVPGQGQWVYTEQYGWIWMPYSESFVYRPSTGAVPQMYVYYPAVGWTWVVAPWVWGLGPQPNFGVVGPSRFVWWGRGYGHWHGFSGEYAHWGTRGYWSGGRWNGHRDVYVVPHRDGAWVGHGDDFEGRELFEGHEDHVGHGR